LKNAASLPVVSQAGLRARQKDSPDHIEEIQKLHHAGDLCTARGDTRQQMTIDTFGRRSMVPLRRCLHRVEAIKRRYRPSLIIGSF
jgi:hypothetical protein